MAKNDLASPPLIGPKPTEGETQIWRKSFHKFRFTEELLSRPQVCPPSAISLLSVRCGLAVSPWMRSRRSSHRRRAWFSRSRQCVGGRRKRARRSSMGADRPGASPPRSAPFRPGAGERGVGRRLRLIGETPPQHIHDPPQSLLAKLASPIHNSRTSTLRLRPPCLAAGISASICAHSLPVRSLGLKWIPDLGPSIKV